MNTETLVRKNIKFCLGQDDFLQRYANILQDIDHFRKKEPEMLRLASVCRRKTSMWQLFPANIWPVHIWLGEKQKSKHWLHMTLYPSNASEHGLDTWVWLKVWAKCWWRKAWQITLEENFRCTSASSAKLFFSWAQASPRVLRRDNREGVTGCVWVVNMTQEKGPHTL